jgi:polysaccharide biosynthesis/export protein/SLBB domain-containing protein
MRVNHRKQSNSFDLLMAVMMGALLVAGLQAQARDQGTGEQNGKPIQSTATPTPAAPAAGDPDPTAPWTTMFWTSGRYRITPSDVLELRFPYVPEFDQTVTVQPDGYISLRGASDIRAQGRTLPELQVMLAEAYANILREPVINIILKEFEKPYVIVTGEVARPGKYELRGATTVTQGLALAGGYTSAAKHSQVVLYRRFQAEWLEVKLIDVKKMYDSRNMSEDPVLRPGDTIFVPKSAIAKMAPYIPRPGIGFYLPIF